MNKLVVGFLTLMISLSAFAGREVKGCNAQEKREIYSNFTFASNHWSAFERYVERRMNINLKNCIENKFKKHGKVICESSSKGNCKGANGWAMFGSRKIHFCPSFRNKVRSLPTVEARKTCYFALMAHEFAHNCFRAHGKVEPLDNLAFEFAASRFGASVDMLRDCQMD